MRTLDNRLMECRSMLEIGRPIGRISSAAILAGEAGTVIVPEAAGTAWWD